MVTRLYGARASHVDVAVARHAGIADDPPVIRCAFLSTDDLDGYVVDDDRAVAPLARRGVHVERVPWRARADWDGFDIVVVRSTWDYQRDSAAFERVLETIDGAGAVLANPLPALRWNLRKTYLADLATKGVAIVPTQFGEGLDAARFDALCAHFAGREWILKPDIGANAEDVLRLPASAADARRNDALARFAARGWMAQPFIHDVTAHGEYSLFYFDGDYSHAILKTPKPGDFRVQEEHGGHIAAVRADRRLRSAADAVCAQLPGDCLYVRVDLVRLGGGEPAVMEVELIEPSLYLRTDRDAPERFADALVRWLSRQRSG